MHTLMWALALIVGLFNHLQWCKLVFVSSNYQNSMQHYTCCSIMSYSLVLNHLLNFRMGRILKCLHLTADFNSRKQTHKYLLTYSKTLQYLGKAALCKLLHKSLVTISIMQKAVDACIIGSVMNKDLLILSYHMWWNQWRMHILSTT